MSTTSTGLVSSNGTELIAGASYTDGNGINVSETVAAIIQADRAPETAWTTDETNITNQESALTTLQTDIATLQTSFESLNDYSGVFDGMTATSSDDSAVTATAGSTATSGTHTVVVTNLATTGESYSNEITSGSISSGALVIEIGTGTAQTINIPADADSTDDTTTLANAASYINEQDLGVTATVITDSGGSRLSLTSTTSGSAASVSVESAPSGLTFTNVAGQDASLTVDGVPIDSATNTVTSAITGVTLDLTNTTSSSGVTVQLAADTSSITTAVSSFITAYNAIVTDLNSQFQYNGGVAAGSTTASSDSTSGVLESDPSARLIQQQLLAAISVTGSDSTSSTSTSSSSSSTSTTSAISELSDLGITMNNDGTLTLDSTTLQSALDSNYSGVESFFESTTSASFAGNFNNLLTNLTDPSDSAVTLDLNGLASNYTTDEDNVNNLETQLTALQATLTTQYSTLNTTLQMYPTNLMEVETELGYRTTTDSSSSS